MNIKLALLCVFFCSECAFAKDVPRQFLVAQTAETEAISGQVDWPDGDLALWRGPVVVFVSAGGANDRNGWLVRALETVWAERAPLRELSAALVASGVAVVRFDNPGVRPPNLKCQEAALKPGFTKAILERRCVDVQVLANVSVERYQLSIENVLLHIEDMVPAARGRLILLGFSEGLMHAAAIADRERVRLGGLMSIGSPAQRFEAATRWQAVERILEILPEFDINADSIVTNPEIRKRYKEGLGNVMGLNGWLSPYGQWDAANQHEFKARLEESYAVLMQRTDTGTAAGKLSWKRQTNGVMAPDTNDGFWNMHFHSQISPLAVMRRLSIPGLFLWGERDLQVGVSHEAEMLRQACEAGVPGLHLQFVRFDGRHHLLSTRLDFDWMEKNFMSEVADEVQVFLKRGGNPNFVRQMNPGVASTYRCQTQMSIKSEVAAR
jgi:pimeloyl-ACP methyl ester carboxylesterase